MEIEEELPILITGARLPFVSCPFMPRLILGHWQSEEQHGVTGLQNGTLDSRSIHDLKSDICKPGNVPYTRDRACQSRRLGSDVLTWLGLETLALACLEQALASRSSTRAFVDIFFRRNLTSFAGQKME